MQICIRKIQIKKSLEKLGLARSWAPFGEGLGRSVVSLGRSWPLLGHFFGRLKPNFYKALVPNGPQEAFWMDSGSIWEGFGENLGGSWGDSGSEN